jgi:oligopeptide transport system ATP-binding protein
VSSTAAATVAGGFVAVEKGETLIEVKNLKKYFPVLEGIVFQKAIAHVKAVDDVTFSIKKGETLGLVGESGCGKTTTGRCILQLERPTAGDIVFEGVNLCGLDEKELVPVRQKIQVIFQDPYSSLNPRMKIGDIIGEPMKVHGIQPAAGKRRERVAELLSICGLDPAFADRYPHEMSGGQRQRVGIGRALALNPEFIICDEAVSALDVSIQAQVINLLEDLREEFGLTYLFIAHDLSVVHHLCDRGRRALRQTDASLYTGAALRGTGPGPLDRGPARAPGTSGRGTEPHEPAQRLRFSPPVPTGGG